jgi:hypothetical protein
MTADRAQKDRGLERLPEEADGGVDRADIDQATGPQLIRPEAVAVGLNRGAIVAAGRHPSPVLRRQPGAGDRLEVEDIDRIGRR